MGTDEGSEKKKKPFYRNVEDTLEDVGITQRQLGYWRKQGLFTPELGSKAKFFTEDDTARLRFLKRLIDDLGLPVATVKRLVSAATYSSEDAESDPSLVWAGPPHHHTFIDIENTRLVEPADAMHELVADAMAGRKSWRVEQLLEWTMLLALRSAWMSSPSLDVYEAHIKSLHDRLERIDLLSRLQREAAQFWPKRSKDPDLTSDLIDELTEEKKNLTSAMDAARQREYWT